MPRLQAPLVPLGEDPATVVARLRRNMDALNTLSGERAGEEGQQCGCHRGQLQRRNAGCLFGC